MKRMICDTLLVAGALAFVVVLGAVVEHTMPLGAALALLAALAAGLRGLYRLEQSATRRKRRAHGRYRPAHDHDTGHEPLRAA